MWQRYFNDIRTRLSHWWRVLELESLGQLTRKTTRVVARRLRTRLKRVRHSRSLESATCSRGVESLEQRQVLSGSKFDFGTGSSPIELGFIRAPVAAYTAARGWGWSTTAGIGAIDRGVGDANSPAMTRDFHYGRNNTFRVNVANGTYDIVVQLGDASARRDQVNVDLEGTRVVTGIDTPRGQFFRATFRTTVLDGELTVRLTDTGGVNPYWTFDGLEIHPLATSETLATVGLTSGWATFGQALPQGAAFDALQIGSLPTQTDIKTRWPDGSIRFAVLTTEVDADGSYPIKPAFAATGHVELGQLPAEVRLTTALLDQPSVTAAIPSAIAPDSMWLDGSQVSEGRWSVVPTDTNGQPLSGLRVLFDQRTYRNGARRLEVTIENSDDTADNQLRNLAVQIWTDADHNGLLDELLFDRHDLAMGSGTRFVQRFNWDLNSSAVTPDLEPVFASGALPRYAAGVSDVIGSAFDENGQLRPEFDLLGPGDLNPYMGSGGGRSDIGPYTEWTARYLAHQHAQQADYLLRLGDLAGSWPIHLREPTDGHLVSLTERPNFWFDDRGEDHMRSAQWGGSPLSPDNAHVPGGLSLIPYLLTGDRYYADELAFWANYAVLSTWPGNSPTDAASRSGGDAAAGFGRGILATNQVRGFAWGLRNISDAAAYLPDSDAMQTPLRRIVTENLSWLDNWAKTKTGPLKMAWLPGYGTEVDGTQRFAQLWMYEYLAWSIQHANDLGFVGGLRFRDQVVKFQTELFVNPSYNREYAAPGRLAIGQVSADGSSTRYFTSLAEVLAVTRRSIQPGTFAGYYGVEARLTLLIGIDSGADGSSGYRGKIRAALNFLNDATKHPGMFNDPLDRAQFGLRGPDHQ